MEAATKTNILMKTENMPRISIDFDEDKDDTTKDAYTTNSKLYIRCLRSDIKILVGDFNAKVEREGIFGPVCTRKQATMASDWYP